MKEDQIELKKLYDEFRKNFPQFGEEVNAGLIESVIGEPSSHVMLWVDMDNSGELRSPEKNLLEGLHVVVFLHTDVNPNGVTGPEDIVRTYDIGIEIKGRVRRYRCKRFNDETVWKKYNYSRTIPEIINMTREWIHAIPSYLEERIKWKR